MEFPTNFLKNAPHPKQLLFPTYSIHHSKIKKCPLNSDEIPVISELHIQRRFIKAVSSGASHAYMEKLLRLLNLPTHEKRRLFVNLS